MPVGREKRTQDHELAQALELALRESGLTAATIAPRVHWKERTCRRYIRAETRPDRDTVARWENACGVKPGRLTELWDRTQPRVQASLEQSSRLVSASSESTKGGPTPGAKTSASKSLRVPSEPGAFLHGANHRRVCTRADEALRDEFRLARWVQEPEARRRLYFAWCARAARELTLLNEGEAPKHDSVVLMVVAALAEDEAFAGYIRRHGGSFLTDDRNWRKVYRAGAATILEEYLDATENGSWP